MNGQNPGRYENGEGQRFYIIEELNRELVSVTTVTGILNKPALIGWSANMAVEFIQARILDELEQGKLTIADLRKAAVKDIVSQARNYHDELKVAAGDRGTRVHAFVDSYVKAILAPSTLDPFDAGAAEVVVEEDIAEQARRFMVWWSQHKVKPKYSEKKVWSEEGGGYAGTLDDYWEVDGKWYVVDVKTSKGIWPEHVLQLAGYTYAFHERYPGEPINGAGILHISEEQGWADFQLYTMEQIKDEYRKFLCLAWYMNICLELKTKAEPKPKGRKPKAKASEWED